MPLVTNENFNAKQVDQFLNDQATQKQAINNLVRLCKNNHYYGLQIVPNYYKIQIVPWYDKLH